MSYPTIKFLHISCAIVSIAGFALRGWLKLHGSQLVERRQVKVAPHLIDTLLLSSAIYLAITLQQFPIESHWLTAKLLALLLYIGLGFRVLRFAGSELERRLCYWAALLTALYMIAVARTHHPIPWQSYL